MCVTESKAIFCVLLIAFTENEKSGHGSTGSTLPGGMPLPSLCLADRRKILRHIWSRDRNGLVNVAQ